MCDEDSGDLDCETGDNVGFFEVRGMAHRVAVDRFLNTDLSCEVVDNLSLPEDAENEEVMVRWSIESAENAEDPEAPIVAAALVCIP